MDYCSGTLNSSCVTAFSEDFSARLCKLFKNQILRPFIVLWQNLLSCCRMPAAFNLLVIAPFVSQSSYSIQVKQFTGCLLNCSLILS